MSVHFCGRHGPIGHQNTSAVHLENYATASSTRGRSRAAIISLGSPRRDLRGCARSLCRELIANKFIRCVSPGAYPV